MMKIQVIKTHVTFKKQNEGELMNLKMIWLKQYWYDKQIQQFFTGLQ